MDTISQIADGPLMRLRQSQPDVYRLLLEHTAVCLQLKEARLKIAEIRLSEGVAKAKETHTLSVHEAWTAWRGAVHEMARKGKSQHSEARQRMQTAVQAVTAVRDSATAPHIKLRHQVQSAALKRYELERKLADDMELPLLAESAERDLETVLLESQRACESACAAAMQTYKTSLDEVLDAYNQELAAVNAAQSAFAAPFDRTRDIAIVDAGRVLEDATRHLTAEHALDVAEVDGCYRDSVMRRRAAVDTLAANPAELGQWLVDENRRLSAKLAAMNGS